MAGQIQEQRERQYPRAPITVLPESSEPVNHSCQCNHANQCQDLAKLAAKLLKVMRARISIIDSETGATVETDGIGQGYDGGDKALSKAQTQARKYALLLALNISTGEDPEADEKTDKAQVPAVPCFKCHGPAAFIKDEDFEGKPVKIFFCEKCKKETRKAA